MSGFGTTVTAAILCIVLIGLATGLLSVAFHNVTELSEAFKTSADLRKEATDSSFIIRGLVVVDNRTISFNLMNDGFKKFSPTELKTFDLIVKYWTSSLEQTIAWLPYTKGAIAQKGWNYTFPKNYITNPVFWDSGENLTVMIRVPRAMASNSLNSLTVFSSNGVGASTYFRVA